MSSIPQPHKRKQTTITSICQDIIYSASNTKHKTSKHVLLSLCTKRKTGSKDLVKWLNRFGHCISYDETAYLETFLANEEIKNQMVKFYVPYSVQLSSFITFVWDNNDINPETLSRTSMHCTNGIIVQLRRDDMVDFDSERINYAKPPRRRSFKYIPDQLEEYTTKKR